MISYTITYHLRILTFSIYKLVDLTVSYFVLNTLSRDRLSVNFWKFLLYLLISIYLLTGQFSDLSTAALSMSRSCSTSSQLNNIWSIVCSPLLQEHIGLSLILNLYKYALIFPCPVTIVVKFGVTLIFHFNLSAILGKNNFVIAPFVVLAHSPCHFITLLSLNSLLTVLRGVHHLKVLLEKAIIFCFKNVWWYIFHGIKRKNNFACVYGFFFLFSFFLFFPPLQRLCLLLAWQFLVGFGLLNNYLLCISNHSHHAQILCLHFSQIHSFYNN